MRRRMFAIILALAALGAATAPVAAQSEGIAVGETPELPVLATLSGDSVDLADVVGTKPVLLEFWATWCPICRALQPQMRDAHDAYGDRVDFLVVAVGVNQDPASIEAHLARHPVAGRVLWDGRGAAVRAFESPGTGYIVILDGDGKVAYAGTGVEQDIVAALAEVIGD